MGVSAWMNHGKKYGYNKFWKEKEKLFIDEKPHSDELVEAHYKREIE